MSKLHQSKRIRVFATATTLGIAMSLAGCHGHSGNALLLQPKHTVVAFILQAEKYASQKTHLYYANGGTYGMCVVNPKHFMNPFQPNAKNPCHQFFEAMVDYASHTQAFHQISVSDLNNPAVIKRINPAFTQY